MRKIAQKFVVGSGVAPANLYIWDMEASVGSIAPNTYVFFNPRTGRVVSPGVTYAQVPKLGIAQTVDINGDGVSDALRKVYGGFIDGAHLWNVTTQLPKEGMNRIEEVFWKCTEKDEVYTLNVEWRNDDTLDTNLHNQYSYVTLSVPASDYECDSCDTGYDCKELSCAFANQFYNKIADDSKNNLFLRRSLKVQSKDIGVEVQPILAKEVQYCITSTAGDCGDCTRMTAIKSITIDVGGTPQVFEFPGSIGTSGEDTFSFYAQKDRILKLINKAFVTSGFAGSAVIIEGITGTGKPCTGFNLLINSCVSVSLQDDADEDIEPCIAEYSPFTGISFTSQKECEGCSPGSTFVPTCGFRVIGKGIKVDSTCLNKVDRKAWYHTDVRVTTNEDSAFKYFYQRTRQAVVIPQNLGVQFGPMFLDQQNTGEGMDYISSMVDNRGTYARPAEGLAYDLNLLGLNLRGLYASIGLEHGLSWNTTHTNQPDTLAKGTSYLLIENSDTATKTAVLAILNPWLASIPNPRGPISLTVDTDQIALIVDSNNLVTQDPGDVLGA